jgi:hypothetical protein
MIAFDIIKFFQFYGLLAFVLDLNDKDRPGRPIAANDSLLEKLFEQDRR